MSLVLHILLVLVNGLISIELVKSYWWIWLRSAFDSWNFVFIYFFRFYRETAIQRTAMSEMSVRLSVCLSNAWIVTKWKQLVPTFLYRMKNHSS